ncbi:cytosine/adenosine deaminase-related metal-dependent hydrolase [Scopulibacillus daqui]|uniref:Cytosine/adenosine deaminase-related metal-dependent hydrolase n=1 Tax=Scopulibacillus daqui TaxID=1469162 RepID=A0ABS2PX29_9BACL|nr:amidohydrolase [Scopulibacillus daqui]MBM7644604.1 cytosine/adenosine deaminase-related metal-dependent hydrolase [Scopulibacillus daqui]
MNDAFWLLNARLESGYEVEDGAVIGTNTKCHHLLIKDGKIADIRSSNETITDHLPKRDAKQLLALPAFIEKHCHLDKTLLSDRWRPVTPAKNIFERLEIEKKVLPSLETTTQERAETLLDIYVKFGVSHVRTHVDIYPEIGLKHLEDVQKALETFEGKLSYEIVAFPQHGLLRSKAKDLVRESLRQGAGFVGGVDPATVDGDIEASLQEMVELAVEGNAGIDLHLHDADHLGVFTIKRLAQLTKEAGLEGKVAISHAFALGDISETEAEEMAEILADAGITIITSVPINRKFPPVGLLQEKGVPVAVGCDNIFDVWSPFGNGDILERAGRLAEVLNWSDERSLAQTLCFITGGQTPLNHDGEQVWPKAGDEANIVFVEASCSAEAVARRAKRAAVMFKGEIVSGSL